MSFSRMPATWFLTEALFLLLLSFVCGIGVAIAQTSGESTRGSTAPGMSQDGARPADGAIKGGSSIAPGETGGLPNRKPADAAEAKKRCDEMTGSLRDECLEKDNSSATGGTAPREPAEIFSNPMKSK